jgi:aryl-alcohol dehydrogenase-like predicted oxidoreductase
MHYRPLGRTGIHVSPYALGTMNFGVMANADHDEAIRIIHAALDAGINLIDTADVYSHGESEQIVGEAIKARRDEVVLATKFSNPMGDSPNQRGGSRRWITAAVEGSLRRLGTDYIDLYQYHYPDDATDIEETLSALTDLVRAGKVRAIGTSKQPASGIVEAHWVSEKMGFERFRCEQPHYSILNRGHRTRDPPRSGTDLGLSRPRTAKSLLGASPPSRPRSGFPAAIPCFRRSQR